MTILKLGFGFLFFRLVVCLGFLRGLFGCIVVGFLLLSVSVLRHFFRYLLKILHLIDKLCLFLNIYLL